MIFFFGTAELKLINLRHFEDLMPLKFEVFPQDVRLHFFFFSLDAGRPAIGQNALSGQVFSRPNIRTERYISILPTNTTTTIYYDAMGTVCLHKAQHKIVTSGQTLSQQIEYDVYYYGSLMQFEHLREMSV
ncbi:uncharacterized protein LOC132737836 [Ruditapes philippinarum]|uniref:uncharacterized protein LOC132737836 n=1 Tax=Ruditapes philippinarum TaxID=129788 RepID=UPI00295AAB30|nr:uncharacterized protein LOC132737836 [Ruditapes philippinarum]